MTTKTPSQKPEFYKPLPSVLLTALVYLGSQIFAGAIIFGLPAIFGAADSTTQSWLESTSGQFVTIAVVEALVMLMVWGLLKKKKSTFGHIGLKAPRIKDAGYALVGFGIYFLIFMGLAIVVQAILPEVDFKQQQQLGYSVDQTGAALALIFISLVILPPIVEEVLARGFLFTGLRTKLPFWVSGLIVSLLFAAAHLQFGSGEKLLWVAAIDTFALSLVLVYLKEKTGRLGAPIILHMLKNSLAFTLLFVIKVF